MLMNVMYMTDALPSFYGQSQNRTKQYSAGNYITPSYQTKPQGLSGSNFKTKEIRLYHPSPIVDCIIVLFKSLNYNLYSQIVKHHSQEITEYSHRALSFFLVENKTISGSHYPAKDISIHQKAVARYECRLLTTLKKLERPGKK